MNIEQQPPRLVEDPTNPTDIAAVLNEHIVGYHREQGLILRALAEIRESRARTLTMIGLIVGAVTALGQLISMLVG